MSKTTLKFVTAFLLILANSFAFANTIPDSYQKIDLTISSDPQAALSQLSEIEIEKLKPETKAIHYNAISRAYISLVYPEKALEAAEKALSFIPNNEPQWLYFQVLMVKSQAMEISGMAPEALPLAEAVVQWAEANDSTLHIDGLLALGYIENTLGNYLNALDAFMKAYNMAPESGTPNTRSAIASSVALVYEYRRENALAIPFFQESIDYHRVQNNPLELSIALYGLGRAYKNTGNIEKGQAHLDEALNISRNIGDTQGIAYALKELAPYYIDKQEYKTAENMLIEAIDIFSQSQNQNMLLDAHKTMSVLQLKMGQLDAAEVHLTKAKQFVNPERMPIQAITLAEVETRLMAAEGQHKAAYQQLLRTGQEKQKLLSKQSTQALHELRTQFELENKEKTNLLLAQENAEQKLLLLKEAQHKHFLITGLITSGLIVMVLIAATIKNNKQKKQLSHLANYDQLTQLPNRSHALAQLKNNTSQLLDHQHTIIAMLDLDHFKSINDQLGHDIGDQVLAHTGDLFRKFIHPPHFAGRFGGEEFLIIFHNLERQKAIDKLTEIRVAYQSLMAEKFLTHSEISDSLGFSAGVTSYQPGDNIKEKIKEADLAMYQAKNSGRNKTIVST